MMILDLLLWAIAILTFLMVSGPVFFQSIPGAAVCIAIAGLLVYVVNV